MKCRRCGFEAGLFSDMCSKCKSEVEADQRQEAMLRTSLLHAEVARQQAKVALGQQAALLQQAADKERNRAFEKFAEGMALLKESLKLDPSLQMNLATYICNSIAFTVVGATKNGTISELTDDMLDRLFQVAKKAALHCAGFKESDAAQKMADQCIGVLNREKEARIQVKRHERLRPQRESPTSAPAPSAFGRFVYKVLTVVFGGVGGILLAFGALMLLAGLGSDQTQNKGLMIGGGILFLVVGTPCTVLAFRWKKRANME